jgi:phage terminase large subunit-like protein
MGNVERRRGADKKDNVYPNKPREEAKIDNPVALISALGVAMKGEEEPMATSPWDDPGVQHERA